MSILVSEGKAERVEVTSDSLVVDLVDGRTISVPLGWFPRLMHGTDAERLNVRLVGGGSGLHWPELDEDISVEGLLVGRRSAESDESFARWLKARDSKVV
jgi:hypothetical protein